MALPLTSWLKTVKMGLQLRDVDGLAYQPLQGSSISMYQELYQSWA